MPPATLKVVFGHPYSATASALLVSKLPAETEALPPNPCRVCAVVTTSITPPSFRPYSAG